MVFLSLAALLSVPLVVSATAQTGGSVVPTPEPPKSYTLQQKISHYARGADATVAVACAMPQGSAPLDCLYNPDNHPPMQSVFKLPLAMTLLHQVEGGKFTLDQSIPILDTDRLPGRYSPLQDKYPTGTIPPQPLRELLRLSVALSDNAAADILLRLAGGPAVVQAYITALGIKDFHLVDGERGLGLDAHNQFNNWISPRAAVQMLRLLADNSPLTPDDTKVLLEFMNSRSTPTRIRAGVPQGTLVEHKSGTSDVVLGLSYATNDIGLIALPDGRKLAVAIFMTNSTDPSDERDFTIAHITQVIYEAATGIPAFKKDAATP